MTRGRAQNEGKAHATAYNQHFDVSRVERQNFIAASSNQRNRCIDNIAW